ncbi:MAG: hypothetical protein HQL31_04350, partial [Planctomycetes bacterium]|nr:hypothetical protein [Planctomycetota bacterium]
MTELDDHNKEHYRGSSLSREKMLAIVSAPRLRKSRMRWLLAAAALYLVLGSTLFVLSYLNLRKSASLSTQTAPATAAAFSSGRWSDSQNFIHFNNSRQRTDGALVNLGPARSGGGSSQRIRPGLSGTKLILVHFIWPGIGADNSSQMLFDRLIENFGDSDLAFTSLDLRLPDRHEEAKRLVAFMGLDPNCLLPREGGNLLL